MPLEFSGVQKTYDLPNSEGSVQVEPGALITIGWKTDDCRALDAP
ncbi:hypothetical protein [Bradyrhizobium australiense]|nr:hypothetical protein [Bradyrhizobium australiense]